MIEPSTTHAQAHAQRMASRRWRIGTPLVVATSAVLVVVSALNAHGTDLRPGRYTDLAQLTASESQRYQRLEDQVHELDGEVASLTAQVGDTSVRTYRQQAAELRTPAGFTRVTGSGLSITLTNAPDDLIEQTDPDDRPAMVVHQQDIQAVVNALWRGGASAITVAGQRIISTTGIKCTGSTVTLQGVPYPEPFVIEAVGDVEDLTTAIDADAYVQLYRDAAENPTVDVGWEMESSDNVVAPAYTGLSDLSYARPLDN
ncbi:DUF881 domain-containing protein [Nocardioides sp. Kera G14]|uniref:DUF881 domain-containing protein n=1 Tax=Nocardioides sp. Kera G14 TaxID=2884264 RepID=UPI001D11C93B|nr:DUF881 domain-containing protein [Nocardioides sp. Kera G14]UDY23626.1 DUF881 domain-containing protein [Nocardioides sp. Kera G14]